MTDFDKVHFNCMVAQRDGHEIDDATARVIASMFHSGQNGPAYAFASTGAINGDVYGDVTDDSKFYRVGTNEERLAFDMLGTYLIHRTDKGAVKGWSSLWV